MKCTFLLVLFLFVNVNSTFYAGRVKPGKFEYPKLNGMMLVGEAVRKCEADLACGGFTFKGSYLTRNIPMNIYFFHLVQEDMGNPKITLNKLLSSMKGLASRFEEFLNLFTKKEVRYYYWSTYVAEKDYIMLNQVKIKDNSQYSVEDDSKCER